MYAYASVYVHFMLVVYFSCKCYIYSHVIFHVQYVNIHIAYVLLNKHLKDVSKEIKIQWVFSLFHDYIYNRILKTIRMLFYLNGINVKIAFLFSSEFGPDWYDGVIKLMTFDAHMMYFYLITTSNISYYVNKLWFLRCYRITVSYDL